LVNAGLWMDDDVWMCIVEVMLNYIIPGHMLQALSFTTAVTPLSLDLSDYDWVIY